MDESGLSVVLGLYTTSTTGYLLEDGESCVRRVLGGGCFYGSFVT